MLTEKRRLLGRWMARCGLKALRRPRIGLALSGGAVRGAAHIGVLEVLEREGIRPDVIAGVSAGSAVGALYCAGFTPAHIGALAAEMRWSRVTRLTRPGLSIFDTSRMESYIDELIGGKTFEQLDMPFVALAVDLLSCTEVPLREGSVARAVRASCAIPGLFSPVEWGPYLLVDGGVLTNLPVRILRAMGVDYVIGVDVMTPGNSYRPPRSFLEVWMVSAQAVLRRAQYADQDADLVIEPAVQDLNLVDFRQVPELIERGRRAAEATLPRLCADLGI